jgi:hypothetical protein
LYTTCSPYVLQKEELLTKIYLYRTKCEQCDYSSEYPCVLKSHVQSVHEKIRHKCDLCERTYASKNGVRRHVKNVHGPTRTETTEADTNSSTDENDRVSDDTDYDENSTDEDSDIFWKY